MTPAFLYKNNIDFDLNCLIFVHVLSMNNVKKNNFEIIMIDVIMTVYILI